jgi:hypothetical protein
MCNLKTYGSTKEKTTLPPFALVVLPTHLTNEVAKKTLSTTPAN